MNKLKQSIGEIDAIRPLDKWQEVSKKNINKQKQKEVTKQSQTKLQGNT